MLSSGASLAAPITLTFEYDSVFQYERSVNSAGTGAQLAYTGTGTGGSFTVQFEDQISTSNTGSDSTAGYDSSYFYTFYNSVTTNITTSLEAAFLANNPNYTNNYSGGSTLGQEYFRLDTDSLDTLNYDYNARSSHMSEYTGSNKDTIRTELNNGEYKYDYTQFYYGTNVSSYDTGALTSLADPELMNINTFLSILLDNSLNLSSSWYDQSWANVYNADGYDHSEYYSVTGEYYSAGNVSLTRINGISAASYLQVPEPSILFLLGAGLLGLGFQQRKKF